MAKEAAPRTLSPEGKLYIDKAAEMRSQLLEALKKASSVVVKWDSVEDIELPVLQIFYAARKEAAETGKTLHFAGAVSERVATRLLKSGFVREIPVSGEELETALVDF